jgi:transcriptional regulator with XRE-family HTH domain
MSSFGNLIEQARRAKRITLRELAGWVGLKPSALSEMEHGRRLPPKKEEQIVSLAKILEIEKNKLKEVALRERTMKKSKMSEKLYNVDPDLAWGFCRAVEEMPKNELEDFMKELLEKYQKKQQEVDG